MNVSPSRASDANRATPFLSLSDSMTPPVQGASECTEYFRKTPAERAPKRDPGASSELYPREYCDLKLRHFRVDLISRQEEVLRSSIYTMECDPLCDEVEVVPFFMLDGKPCIVTSTTFAPALLHRIHFLAQDIFPATPHHRALPGYRCPVGEGSAGEGDALREAVERDWGLIVTGEITRSPQRFFASGGSSSAAFGMAFIPVDERSVPRAGEHHTLCALPVDAIIRGFFSGTITDLRLVLAAYQLARRTMTVLPLPSGLTAHTCHGWKGQSRIPIIRYDEATNRCAMVPQRNDIPAGIRMYNHSSAEQQFLHVDTVRCGESLQEKRFPVLIRRGIDSVDIGTYFYQHGEPHVVMKIGIRPTIAARALREGQSIDPQRNDPRCGFTIEGIAESLEGERTIAELLNRAKQGVREEAGIEPIFGAALVGSTYPLPHRHVERVYTAMAEVDPSVPGYGPYTLDERVDLFALSAVDTIRLSEEGHLRDPRLLLQAYILESQGVRS